MHYGKLGSTGLEIPEVGYGAWDIGVRKTRGAGQLSEPKSAVQ